MTGTTPSSKGLDARRRKLLYRSWHCGMRELDLILGSFADAHLSSLSEGELDSYENLLGAPDNDLLRWITGEQSAPARYASLVLAKIRSHCCDIPA